MPPLAFDRKDILLTGASGAIGSAIARRLAGAGFSLHLTSRDPSRLASLEAEISRSGARTHHYALDLQDRARCEKVVDEFFQQAASPLGLICNAGDLGVLGPFLQTDFTVWARSVEQNFMAHALMIRAFGNHFASSGRKGGTIVVLSGAGLGGAIRHPNLSSYGTAKAAL